MKIPSEAKAYAKSFIKTWLNEQEPRHQDGLAQSMLEYTNRRRSGEGLDFRHCSREAHSLDKVGTWGFGMSGGSFKRVSTHGVGERFQEAVDPICPVLRPGTQRLREVLDRGLTVMCTR